jgi:hypothetical protein
MGVGEGDSFVFIVVVIEEAFLLREVGVVGVFLGFLKREDG